LVLSVIFFDPFIDRLELRDSREHLLAHELDRSDAVIAEHPPDDHIDPHHRDFRSIAEDPDRPQPR
jgi:hypothetical protein